MGRPKKPRIGCPVCGKPVANVRCQFCSTSCQKEHQYQVYIGRWLAGEETGNRGDDRSLQVSRHVRRYLREKLGNRCTRCGWAEVNLTTGKVPLNVEHIDGNPYNSIESNLTLLCPNCHSLTATFGPLNKGSGRGSRALHPDGLQPKIPSEPNICSCGAVILKGSRTCIPCLGKLHQAARGVAWPSSDELRALVWQQPVMQIAKTIGVSDVAVQKHCTHQGIPTPPRGYWTKAARGVVWPSDDELRVLVWQQPVVQLAKTLGVSDVAVKKHCKKRGIPTPPRGYWAKQKVSG